MVGADADPPTAHGRCWVTVEQLGMWPLDHGCCSFIPRVEIKTFLANAVELVVTHLGRQYSPVFSVHIEICANISILP